MSTFGSLLRQKRGFLIAVYATLLAQIAILYGVMRSSLADQVARKHFLLVALGFIGSVLLLSLVPMPTPLKLFVLCLLSGLLGILFRRLADYVPGDAVKSALLSASGVFIAMTVAGVILASSGIDLGPMGLYLFAALLGLAVAQVVLAFTKPSSLASGTPKIVYTLTIVLFALYTVYDTNQILQRNYAGDFVSASTDFLLDFANIFSSILEQQT